MEIVSLIVAIIAVGISIWSVYKSEHIAKKSGAFDKGKLRLSFDDFNILENQTYDVYFGINFNSDEINLLEFPISVANIGNKSVEDIVLINNYPSEMRVAIDNDLLEIKSILGDDINRKYFSSKPFDQVSLNLKSLNPKAAINMFDLISTKETSIKNHKISTKTKDGKNVEFNVNVTYFQKIISTLSAKDIISQNFQFNVQNINSTNLHEILKQVVKLKLSKKDDNLSNRNFIILITEVENTIENDDVKVNQLKIIKKSSSLFKFDDEMKYIFQYNRDLTIKNIFDSSQI